MKRITAILGNSNSELEKQTKELLNDMAAYFDKQHYDRLCSTCLEKAIFMTIDLVSELETSFCRKCLNK